jgi:hypothetical protein
MTNASLARRARRQARRALRQGEIDENAYELIVNATHNDRVLTEWNKQIYEAKLNPWEHPGVLMGFDWQVIWDWFAANWPKILEILLALLPLLILEDRDADPEPTT